MAKSRAEKLIKRSDDLFSSEERAIHEREWQKLTEYMLNNHHGAFNNASKPANNNVGTEHTSNKTKNIYDSTALQAVQDLASSMQSTLTNPATTWSKLRYEAEHLNNSSEAVEWLEEVNKTMHRKIQDSNFDTEISKMYQSLITLAQGCLFIESNDDDTGFRFTCIHISQVAWTENKDGIANSFYRRLRLTVEQAIEKWGSAVHPSITKLLDSDPDKEFEFLHVIAPRTKHKTGYPLKHKDRPIESTYIDIENQTIVVEEGHYEMPMFAARWSMMPNERYARGPAHIALPDTLTLNTVTKQGLRSVAKQNDPPLLVNRRDAFGTLRTGPNTVSVVNDVRGVAIMPTGTRNEVRQQKEEDLKRSIKSIFFLDKLLLPPRNETGEMTATEIIERTQQMQRVLGPVLSRLYSELFNPAIVRMFKILLRSEGLLPEMPNMEEGLDVEIVFVNQLARAQQFQDVETIMQSINIVRSMMELNPEVIDTIDLDAASRRVNKVLGVPEEIIRNEDEVISLRKARAEQQQQQQALDAGTQLADIQSKVQPK